MKYFILNSTFRPDRPEGPAFKEALDAHHAYLDPIVAEGKVLFSGPKPAGGGVMVMKAESEDEIQTFIDNDPFVSRGVQTYDVIEFKAFNVLPEIKDWFE